MKTLINKTSFLFCRPKQQDIIARAPFDTLTATFEPGVSEDEKGLIEYILAEYQAGEEFKNPLTGNIILGPQRDWTHVVKLHACGNPDYSQYADIGPKKTVHVCGIDEAIKVVRDYQSYYNMGGGNCGRDHGSVYELKAGGKRKKVGKVCYGGRYDTLAEIKAWEAKMKARYGKR